MRVVVVFVAVDTDGFPFRVRAGDLDTRTHALVADIVIQTVVCDFEELRVFVSLIADVADEFVGTLGCFVVEELFAIVGDTFHGGDDVGGGTDKLGEIVSLNVSYHVARQRHDTYDVVIVRIDVANLDFAIDGFGFEFHVFFRWFEQEGSHAARLSHSGNWHPTRLRYRQPIS
jgi:hypothetical protein